MAAEKLYHFTWHSFADKIIEESKDRANDLGATWMLLSAWETLLTSPSSIYAVRHRRSMGGHFSSERIFTRHHQMAEVLESLFTTNSHLLLYSLVGGILPALFGFGFGLGKMRITLNLAGLFSGHSLLVPPPPQLLFLSNG